MLHPLEMYTKEYLTPDYAREVDLPSILHPIQRVKKIQMLAGHTAMGAAFLTNRTIFTRGSLVKLVEESLRTKII